MAVDVNVPMELRIRWWATWLSNSWWMARRVPGYRRLHWALMLRGIHMRMPNGPWQRLRSRMPR